MRSLYAKFQPSSFQTIGGVFPCWSPLRTLYTRTFFSGSSHRFCDIWLFFTQPPQFFLQELTGFFLSRTYTFVLIFSCGTWQFVLIFKFSSLIGWFSPNLFWCQVPLLKIKTNMCTLCRKKIRRGWMKKQKIPVILAVKAYFWIFEPDMILLIGGRRDPMPRPNLLVLTRGEAKWIVDNSFSFILPWWTLRGWLQRVLIPKAFLWNAKNIINLCLSLFCWFVWKIFKTKDSELKIGREKLQNSEMVIGWSL